MQEESVSTSELRSQCRRARKALSQEQHRLFSNCIAEQLMTLDSYRSATTIAAYLDYDGEVQTASMIKAAWENGKHIVLPIVQDEYKLLFLKYTPATILNLNRYKIREPEINDNSEFTTVDDIDVFLVPLVGFDANCNRLGFGGGYYDRALTGINAATTKIGVAYEAQQLKQLQPKPWDIPLDYIISEKHIYKV